MHDLVKGPGADLDAATKQRSEQLTTYDPDDFVTHGVIVGMTGSGKTEVYFEAVTEAVRQGRQSLILMPEIALTGQFLDRFAQRFGAFVVDGFGSTEGGVAIARTPDTPAGALGPLTDEVAIVDVETGLPCPAGVVGELVNPTGRGWFRGYYNNEAAEAERMAGGVYHTGDLAYRDDAGFIYFAGRLGDWMRVDGENLGTAPIEQVLLRHPDVVEAAVYAIPDPAVGDQVMSALVLLDDATFSADDFSAFLAAQDDLGPKQWPRFVRVAATLPRTETFKVIKRQLSAEGTDCVDPVFAIAR